MQRDRGCGCIGGFLDFRIGGAENDLDVTRMALVGVDTTMSTVCAATSFLFRGRRISKGSMCVLIP